MANNKLKRNYKNIANAIRNKTGENGLIKAEEMASKIDSIPVGIEPEGTKNIRANGEYNIREFEFVDIDVPGATTKDTFEATENGTFDIAEYANVHVDVPNPSTGTLNITVNGEYNVTEKAAVDVNVPNPSTGTLDVTENGNYDVTNKAEVAVNCDAAGIGLGVTSVENRYYKYSGSQYEVYTYGDDNLTELGEDLDIDNNDLLLYNAYDGSLQYSGSFQGAGFYAYQTGGSATFDYMGDHAEELCYINNNYNISDITLTSGSTYTYNGEDDFTAVDVPEFNSGSLYYKDYYGDIVYQTDSNNEPLTDGLYNLSYEAGSEYWSFDPFTFDSGYLYWDGGMGICNEIQPNQGLVYWSGIGSDSLGYVSINLTNGSTYTYNGEAEFTPYEPTYQSNYIYFTDNNGSLKVNKGISFQDDDIIWADNYYGLTTCSWDGSGQPSYGAWYKFAGSGSFTGGIYMSDGDMFYYANDQLNNLSVYSGYVYYYNGNGDFEDCNLNYGFYSYDGSGNFNSIATSAGIYAYDGFGSNQGYNLDEDWTNNLEVGGTKTISVDNKTFELKRID